MKTTGPGQALCILTLTGLLATHAGAADKVTFDDNVLPIFRNNCLKCHNPNEAKGGLDLSNFGGAVKGGASGTSVASGDPDGSKLFRSITHAEEPTMPPNAKLPEKDIAVVRAWITGGLLETTGSKAIASNKPKIDMAVDPAALKPKEPLPMPQDLLLQPVVHTERASVATGMAHCPWAPLIALGGQRQVLLYNSDTLELAGILPFPEGYPHVVKFSRSGKLVLAGGGEGARQGKVAVWEIATGQRILTVGEEFDTVLAADLSGDQKWIALGGPDRLVKIYSTEDGQLKHSLKKHTDWVTSVEFSPDGKLLATGDRNGNLHVWEAVSGQELYNLKGHRDWITALSWRPDSEYLVSASEDGTAKLWKVKEEQQARSWNTHGGGALFAHVALDGRTVTCGRDNQVSIWDANAQRQRQIASTNDLPVRAVFNHEAKRVIVGDWLGNVNVYNAEDGKHLGTLSLNPPTLEQQLEKASTDLAKINEGAARLEEALKAAQAEAAKFAALAEDSARAFEAAKLNESGGKTEQEQLKEHKAQLEAANQRMAEAKQALEQTGAQRTTVQARIAGLKAAQFNVQVHAAREQFAARELEHARRQAAAKQAEGAVEAASSELKAIRRQLDVMPDKVKGMENVLKFDRQFAREPVEEWTKLQRELGKLDSAVQKAAAEAARVRARAAAAGRNPDEEGASAVKAHENLKGRFETLQQEAAGRQAAAEAALQEIEKDQAQLAKLREEEKAWEQKARSARETLKKAESELAAARSEAEKTAKMLTADKERLEKLRAEYHQLRAAPAAQTSARS